VDDNTHGEYVEVGGY